MCTSPRLYQIGSKRYRYRKIQICDIPETYGIDGAIFKKIGKLPKKSKKLKFHWEPTSAFWKIHARICFIFKCLLEHC